MTLRLISCRGVVDAVEREDHSPAHQAFCVAWHGMMGLKDAAHCHRRDDIARALLRSLIAQGYLSGERDAKHLALKALELLNLCGND